MTHEEQVLLDRVIVQDLIPSIEETVRIAKRIKGYAAALEAPECYKTLADDIEQAITLTTYIQVEDHTFRLNHFD